MDLYRIVRFLYDRLPQPVIDRIGRSNTLWPLRELILRPGGSFAVATREIEFEELRFEFTAPFRSLSKAERNGVEASLCRLVRAGYAPGTMAIDVGANFGFVTCVLARSGARVLALECDPRVLPVLRANSARVAADVIEARVGDGSAGTKRLDDLVAERTSVVKIDTDGTELEVLRGAMATLTRDRPLIVVETNGKTREMVELLREVGYTYFGGVKGEPFERVENLVAYTRPISAPAPRS